MDGTVTMQDPSVKCGSCNHFGGTCANTNPDSQVGDCNEYEPILIYSPTTATTVSTSALTCSTCKLFGNGCAQINPDHFVENCADYITNASDYVGVNEHAEAKSKSYVCDSCPRKGRCGTVPTLNGTCVYGPSADDLRDMEHMKNLLNNITSMVHSVKKESEPDMVNHPNHYTQGGIECIKAIEASMPPDGFQDYCKGNVLKYVWRFRQKNGLEDLKKARVYLNWMIESLEKEQENNGSL